MFLAKIACPLLEGGPSFPVQRCHLGHHLRVCAWPEREFSPSFWTQKFLDSKWTEERAHRCSTKRWCTCRWPSHWWRRGRARASPGALRVGRGEWLVLQPAPPPRARALRLLFTPGSIFVIPANLLYLNQGSPSSRAKMEPHPAFPNSPQTRHWIKHKHKKRIQIQPLP